ncbi:MULTISPECIES: hypothetical protein [Bacillota]|uniref:hypothetical protein n=1 Tax=Bacillota TaxID=1239 RepID=UPI00210A67A5|nr:MULTISPECIES: hypothetical protein [Bacillota]MCQ4895007.1 hypothetical protein [Anaerotruncus sp. DFI.9.16]MCQ4954078.1 hypothetical protein [Holdemania filiformis]
MTGPYDDILHLPHPTSKRHPRMPIADRAAQFSPFAALTGHGAAIEETARVTDRRIELDEDAKEQLDQTLQLLLERIDEQPEITVTWFSPDKKKAGGQYHTATGKLKRIDSREGRLTLTDGNQIPLEDLLEIRSESFQDDP